MIYRAESIRMRIILSLILFLFSCGGPQGQIKGDIKRACESANLHDYQEFSRFVDVDGMIQSYLKSSLSVESYALGILFAGSISTELQKSIKSFIETNGTVNFKSLRLGEAKIDGKSAHISAEFIYKKYDKPSMIILRLRKLESNWQIAEVDISAPLLLAQMEADSTCAKFNRTDAIEMADGAIENEIMNCQNCDLDYLKTEAHRDYMIEKFSIHKKCEPSEIIPEILESFKDEYREKPNV